MCSEGTATPDDNSILPIPNHVVLNHLTASAIRNGVLAVGTTTRYKRKVTVLSFFSLFLWRVFLAFGGDPDWLTLALALFRGSTVHQHPLVQTRRALNSCIPPNCLAQSPAFPGFLFLCLPNQPSSSHPLPIGLAYLQETLLQTPPPLPHPLSPEKPSGVVLFLPLLPPPPTSFTFRPCARPQSFLSGPFLPAVRYIHKHSMLYQLLSHPRKKTPQVHARSVLG